MKFFSGEGVPQTEVIFYAEADGSCPAVDWVAGLPEVVRDKLWAIVSALELNGHTLRRPHLAPLRDKILELRVKHRRVNYRLLFFFAPPGAVIAHGCTKEKAVDDIDIDRAADRRDEYLRDPTGHTCVLDED